VIGTVANTIAHNAFNNCNSLSAVSIGSSVSAVVPTAFNTNSPITSFTVNASNSYYSSLDSVLFNKLQTQLLIYPNAKLATSYTVPNGVTDINIFYDGSNYSGFTASKYLTDVTISNSVTSIYGYSFINCHKLSNINLGNSLKKFGYASFQACTGLNTVTIPSSVTNIGSFTFINCSSLQSVYFLGNAPTDGFQPFLNTTCTVYYCTDKTGFSNPYQDRPAVAIACGSTNKLFGTGYNAYGQLGLSSIVDKDSLTALSGNWSQVACGEHFTMALSASNNKLFATGYNGNGQLGLGNNGASTYRTTLSALTGNWSQVICGAYHTMALSAGTDKWFGTGANSFGQLGLGYSSTTSPFGLNVLTALTGNWSQVACGKYHTMALSAGTTQLFAAGYNDFGQLGLGDTITRTAFTRVPGDWSQVVSRLSHTMAQSAGTNKWFGTGYNSSGQLGLSNNVTRVSSFSAIPGNWSQMVCGFFSTMALSAGNNAWFGTGANDNYQLGLGNYANKNTFTQLTGNWSQMVPSWSFTMAQSAGTNTWFGVGSNNVGELGLGYTSIYPAGPITTFTQLTGNWSQMVTGQNHTMALSAL
jgi:alpha-tubulin suppressor-like RCC1 family protein